MKKLMLMLGLSLSFLACNDDENEGLQPRLEFNDQFHEGKQGWVADFSDHPEEMLTDWELEEGIAPLPAPLDTTKKAFRISGINHSDDLFMYFKKQATGLKPNQSYTASFAIEFATNAPSEGWMGVGGAPNSVYLGIGVVGTEPKSTVDELGHLRLNISKIDQSSDGEDMKIIGDIGNGLEEFVYTQRKLEGEFTGKTDDKGNLWMIFGTDSGFEAKTTLYYTTVNIKLKEAVSN